MKNSKPFVLLAILILFIPFFTLAQVSCNVKAYGAKGDGKTDDYAALLKVSNYINKAKGGTVYFPKGTYFINAYHTKDNKLNDIAFINCNKLKILGTGAVISVKGDFARMADRSAGRHTFSDNNSIVPLSFKNCTDLDVEGLEINGNVNLMTRDAGVVEGTGHLLVLTSCTNVVLKNLFLHHAASDGIYIAGNSSGITAENIISSNNARQGMSLIKVSDSKFINCKFINTGITGGQYGAHPPRAGVDIEPHGNAPAVNNILFQGCTFENNMGSQFVCSAPPSSSDIKLIGCTINAKNGTYKYQMILAATNVLLQDCNIDVGVGDIYPVWGGKLVGSRVTITHCSIKSSSSGIVSLPKTDEDVITIDHNTLIYTGSSARYFPYIRTKNLKFTSNTIKVPQAALNSNSSSLIENVSESTGNKFVSDNPSVKLHVSYKGARLIRD